MLCLRPTSAGWMALFTCPFIKLSSEVQTASTLKQGKLDFSNLKAMLPSQSFNHDEMQQSYLPSLEFKPDEEAGGLMQSQVLEMEDGANIYPLGLEWDLYQESCFQNGILSTDDLQSLLEFSMPEETQADKFSSATLSSEESMMSPVCQDFKQEKLLDKLKAFPASSTWLLLLKNYMSGCKRLGGEPSFANRFIEAIFFYSSWFDLLDSCMERNDPNRMSMEGDFLSQGIRSIVANEGDERVIRHVGIHLWRSFVRRFGFMETELSLASMHQARLLAELFSSSSCLDICINGKGLTVGSKGTPLVSVSAWKMG